MKLKAALLLCLAAAAIWSVGGAWSSLHRGSVRILPDEVTARFVGREDTAEYYLRERDGFVAVFSSSNRREPVAVTRIEADTLRGTDRLLLESGIPASSSAELLLLLEDLGS